jgi:choline dehydrogenase-like flavoprotein
LLNGTVTELVANAESTAVDTLRVSGARGNRFTVRASVYVLAAGGLENPRLLLASTARSADGLGNGEDLVGRFYMDHPRGEGLARVDLKGLSAEQLHRLSLLGEKSDSPYGKVQLRLTFPGDMQRSEELLNHSLHAHLVSDVHNSAGYLAARRLMARLRRSDPGGGRTSAAADLITTLKGTPDLARYAAQKARGQLRLSELVVVDQMEQEPDPQSRVTVDHRRRDRSGLPRLTLDWRIGASTYRSQKRMHRLFQEILEKAGIRSFQSDVLDRPNDRPPLLEMKHPTGTTRMSPSPKSGVVDADGRVHGIGNLYVTGSSIFPTVGHANPTLLIVALAARLGDQLRRQWARQ